MSRAQLTLKKVIAWVACHFHMKFSSWCKWPEMFQATQEAPTCVKSKRMVESNWKDPPPLLESDCVGG